MTPRGIMPIGRQELTQPIYRLNVLRIDDGEEVEETVRLNRPLGSRRLLEAKPTSRGLVGLDVLPAAVRLAVSVMHWAYWAWMEKVFGDDQS